MSTLETYYDQNPLLRIDRNQWTEYDPELKVAFRQSSIFTPLVQWVDLNPNAALYVTGREAIPGHVNHNEISTRQKYITAAYTDSRERHIRANKRYGGKIQFEEYDELISQWRSKGRAGFAAGILRQHLSGSIVTTHEKIARDAMIDNVNVKTYPGGATTVNGLINSANFKFDVDQLRETNLRLSFRSKYQLGQFGDLANPVPGSNDMLCVTTPGVIFDIENQLESRFQQTLANLQSPEQLNGFRLRYQGWTFVSSWDALLFNTGVITKQVAVTTAIKGGDGAPDPDVDAAVDGVLYVGQSSATVTHYVQCTDLGTGQFLAGDVVTLHVARTTEWGVTDGVDPLDGRTMELEIQTVDETNERLTFKAPVMDDYSESFGYTTLAGSGSVGTAYAFITKAAHIHPVYQVGARGGNFFAIKRGVRLHYPPAIDDFESVTRVSWDEHGEMNKWNGDLWEMHYVRATFGNRGALGL